MEGAMGRRDRNQKKKKERQERLRKEKHLRHFGPDPAEEDEDLGPDVDEDLEEAPPLPSPFHTERALQDMHRAIAERGIQTNEELQAFLAEYNQTGAGRGPLGVAAGNDPRAQAQELAYQAMEQPDAAGAARLARRAVELDPHCVDALTVLTETTSHSMPERIEQMRRAVQIGADALGASFFEENRGRFWGILETRPYMRARERLADLLRRSGNLGEAIEHYEALLDLNPGDNQGNRDVLLGCYLAAEDLEGTQRLFGQYGEAPAAVFAWGHVLERLIAKDFPAAAQARTTALKRNPHVEPFLLGKKEFPSQRVSYYSPGDENEAVLCVGLLAEAWIRHPSAFLWLETFHRPDPSQAEHANLLDSEEAMRWLDAECGETDSSSMVNTLDRAIYLPAHLPLRASACHEILAAAELVAAIRGRPSPYLPRSVLEWVIVKDMLVSHGVVALAGNAVLRVLARSELSTLWAASPQGPAFVRAVNDLLQRLDSQEPAR
jgi:tetratricopeptide (TPR) repeat protein